MDQLHLINRLTQGELEKDILGLLEGPGLCCVLSFGMMKENGMSACGADVPHIFGLDGLSVGFPSLRVGFSIFIHHRIRSIEREEGTGLEYRFMFVRRNIPLVYMIYILKKSNRRLNVLHTLIPSTWRLSHQVAPITLENADHP